tara:strand:+ start:1055 stop:1480 length:426 start_codon:yes stop_codon:yes gene_type:complete
MRPFISTQRIYIEDVDSQGVVYHANYLKFFERARTEMLRSLGFNIWDHTKKTGASFVMRRCQLDFKSPARLDNLATLKTTLSSRSGARLSFHQTLEIESKPCVDLICLLAYINADHKPLRLPQFLWDLLDSSSMNKRTSFI